MIPEIIIRNAPALLIAVPMLAAFVTPVIAKAGNGVMKAWALLATAVTAAIAGIIAWQVLDFGTIIYTFGAAAPGLTIPLDSGGIPVRIIFTIDAMSAFMGIIAAISGFAVCLYAIASEKRQTGQEMFFALLLLLEVGILGMVSTGDLFNFFVFLEINSIAGAALVSYRIRGGLSVEAAMKYGFVSTLGGLIVLTAIGLLYGQYGALNMAMVATRMQFTVLDGIALAMLVTALAMKSGAVPMHFWTPDAYGLAPSSVTAFLVVASQASLYGVFRIVFTLYGGIVQTLDWTTVGWIVIVLGVLSMFVGVTMAIPQHDVKRLMAYHAVSQTGYMLLGVGVGIALLGTASFDTYGIVAMEGGIFHIFNHAMYKGLLFLTAGAIIYRTGTSDLNRMGGLGHSMKWTMLFFGIGALAIAGIPPFNGFASKLMIYESVYLFNPLLAVIAMVVSILTLASFVKVFHAMFMGPKLPEFAEVQEVPAPMLLGMGLLAVIVVLFGVFPDQVVAGLVEPAARALADQGAYIASVLGGA